MEVVVEGEGTEVGAEKDPGPVRAIIYVRPQLDNKRIQDPRVTELGGGKNQKSPAATVKIETGHHRQIEVTE